MCHDVRKMQEENLVANKRITFEEIFQQNENRIYYHMHMLGIRDPYNEFYTEGLYALWLAYKKYEPNKGPLSTYFNFIIRSRLIDLIRKKSRIQEITDIVIEQQKTELENGNRFGTRKSPLFEMAEIEIQDLHVWEAIRAKLTEKQWKWVYYFIIKDMPITAIAKQEDVSTEAIKSWAKQTRKKLR